MVSHLASATQWQRMGKRPHHGICLYLPALHSRETGGIGEFRTLIPMIDWCAEVGFTVLQLLPINDTGLLYYPYGLRSAFALNPIYLNVRPYCTVSEWQTLQALNQGEWLQQERVLELKRDILFREFQKATLHKDFELFLEESEWLDDYASRQENPAFAQYLQYLCFKEFREVKSYAENKGVLLKGDLPILLEFESVDYQQHPHMFYSEFTAGVPPDRYNDQGQNWHFPVYRFQDHEKAILDWWKQRLKLAEKLYHLYRIDHLVGFFRIWSIPLGKKATEGHFIPEQEEAWKPQGERILRFFLEASTILPIAEDLGSVPMFVKELLLELGIPGTKVIPWEQGIPLSDYPEYSMTTVSTHDTETLRAWWKNRPEESHALCELTGLKWEPELSREQQLKILQMSHQTPSRFHINLLQEYFPLVDDFCWRKDSDERINNPADESALNWRYRYRPSVEELTRSEPFKQQVKKCLKENRNSK